jgi:hypothetical protein
VGKHARTSYLQGRQGSHHAARQHRFGFCHAVPGQPVPRPVPGLLEGADPRHQHLTGNLSNFSEGAFTAAAILSSQATSIRAISHCIAGLFDSLGSLPAALNGYAGVKQRPANAPIPDRWRACESELQKVLSPDVAFDPLAFENALRKAREFEKSGPVYDHVHGRLWPMVDVLGKLVSQVQLGSEGSQVMIVQDTLNRLQPAEFGGAFAALPLDVDGSFGPQTDARVRQFQSRNDLDPDGVVGPMTRQALKDLAALKAAA